MAGITECHGMRKYIQRILVVLFCMNALLAVLLLDWDGRINLAILCAIIGLMLTPWAALKMRWMEWSLRRKYRR